MEFTKEFIEANGLNEDQVKAVSGYVQTEIVPTIKKEYDGKANENAEGILSGASKYAAEKLGVALEREKGEKFGDYIQRIADEGLSSKTESLKIKEAELEEKLKNFKGSDELKSKYEAELKKNDDLLKKVADLEPLQGLDEKYAEATQKLTTMQKQVAYSSIKPSFGEDVNKYEADAKWSEFKQGVEAKYNIELVDGKPIAIDKENVHKQVELSDLLAKDENITNLLKGRQQKGTGAVPKDYMSVEGLPFKIPKGVSSTELTKIVREHVLGEVKDVTSQEYAKKFQELYVKAKKLSA
jgi:hypothetical protein